MLRRVEYHHPATQVGFGGPNTEDPGAGRVDSGDRNHDRHYLTRQPRLPGDRDLDWCVRLERVTQVVVADAGAGGGVDEAGGGFEQIEAEAGAGAGAGGDLPVPRHRHPDISWAGGVEGDGGVRVSTER